jgi:hypothetical protein
MEEKFTLIVPMINTSKKYENSVPIEFQYDNKSGKINCVKSIEGLKLNYVNTFSKIYFVILAKHEINYHVSDKIMLSIKNSLLNGIECIFTFLEYPTSSQAETIYLEIQKYNIEGPIFIKDADNMCILNSDIKNNSVLVYPLENTPIVDPQHKSYVAVDDQNFVVNIIEKKVISNLFNCGGYSFKSAQDFINAYEAVQEFEDMTSHMYISHIIYWLILNKKLKFRPIEAIGYEDFEIK